MWGNDTKYQPYVLKWLSKQTTFYQKHRCGTLVVDPGGVKCPPPPPASGANLYKHRSKLPQT